MIPPFFWQPAQWQRTRLWRISRYLWRRRYKSYWLKFQSRWHHGFGHETVGSSDRQGWSSVLRQSWANRHRRLLLSFFLFALAIGAAIWLDIARLHVHPDAKALNEMATVPSPSASPVVTPPPTSIVQFENFVQPKGSAVSSPVADRSSTTPSPSPAGSTPVASPVTSSSPPASPTPASPATPASPTSRPVQSQPQSSPPAYHPPHEIRWAHASNYGDRFAKDIEGKPLTQAPLIVLHETVYSADSAINYFATPHTNEDDQASYHTLIRLDGTIIYIVPPEKRAYGAGNSVFDGPNGPEAAKTHAQYPPSVNNFAYHISLETPIDGENDLPSHSGYTQAQYRSLAWLVAQSSVPPERITTHKAIDRSGSRMDPRSFNFEYFLQLLRQQRGK